MDKINLFTKYPLLIADNNYKVFDGYIHIKEKDYRIKFQIEKYPTIKNIKLYLSTELEKYRDEIMKLTQRNLNVLEFLNLITDLIEQNSKVIDNEGNINKQLNLLQEYNHARNYDKSVKLRLTKDLCSIKLMKVDSSCRRHYISTKVDFNYGTTISYDVIQHSLPVQNSKNNIIKPSKSLIDLIDNFSLVIDNLQLFYDTMDSIDTICWVLDPKRPTRQDVTRRIVIDNNVSIQITFDPWNVRNRPKIQLMGSENRISPFQEKLEENLENWDSEYDIVQNILRLFDLPFFPLEPHSDIKKEIVLYEENECCICFSLRLGTELPNIVCNNKSCEQHFHNECLYEWLSALGTNRQLFNTIHGECPNCTTSISCNIPT